MPVQRYRGRGAAHGRAACEEDHGRPAPRVRLAAKGYAATYAIHTDKAGNNPHAHILVANRRIDPKTGRWAAKRRTEYALDQNGERIPVIDPATGEQKTGARNRKVWKCVDVSNNPLDSKEFLERLRADWAKQCNLMLTEGVRIDHRSLETQGIERIPTIHEGHASREITKRGGHSILNAINRRIATANRYLTAIRKQMGDPTGLLGQFKEQARKELDTAMSRFRESLVFDRQPIASRGRQLVEAPTPPPQEHVRQELGIQARSRAAGDRTRTAASRAGTGGRTGRGQA